MSTLKCTVCSAPGDVLCKVCMELVQRNKPSLLEQKNQSAASAAAAKAKGKPAVAKRGGPPSMALGPPTALPLPVPKPPSAPNGSKAPVIPASVAVRKVLRKRGRAAVEELELDMDEHEEDDVGAAEFEPKPVLRRGPTKIEGDKKAKRGGKRHSEQCWYDEAVEDPETQAKLLELEDQMPFTVVVKAGKKKIHCLGELERKDPQYWNKNYLLPPGFHSSFTYLRKYEFHCYIKRSVTKVKGKTLDHGPIFEVKCEGFETETGHQTPSPAVEGMVRQIMRMNSQDERKVKSQKRHGHGEFGLNSRPLKFLLQAKLLDGDCKGYVRDDCQAPPPKRAYNKRKTPSESSPSSPSAPAGADADADAAEADTDGSSARDTDSDNSPPRAKRAKVSSNGHAPSLPSSSSASASAARVNGHHHNPAAPHSAAATNGHGHKATVNEKPAAVVGGPASHRARIMQKAAAVVAQAKTKGDAGGAVKTEPAVKAGPTSPLKALMAAQSQPRRVVGGAGAAAAAAGATLPTPGKSAVAIMKPRLPYTSPTPIVGKV